MQSKAISVVNEEELKINAIIESVNAINSKQNQRQEKNAILNFTYWLLILPIPMYWSRRQRNGFLLSER